MEAHDLAFRAGFQVSSYGAGNRVRLPGQTQDDPRVFEFGTPYHEMFKRLYEENFHFYSKNGNLQMLDRDRKLKFCPQRWQDETRKFDIVVCFEQRVYELVVDGKRLCSAEECDGLIVYGHRFTEEAV
jgi:RNA polymerase II subunit A C-terminal domain phosphatase SSU72